MILPKIRVFSDADEVAHAAAEHIAAAAMRAQQEFSLMLSGGHTPEAVYRLLAAEPYLSRIHWDCVHIFFGDERCVPPTHADSNFRMANEALLDAAPIPPQNIHRIRGEVEPESAAIEYGKVLKAHFADGGPDLTLLGMGEDGHTASLFPNTAALSETHHRCVANHVAKLNAWRVTTTASFINRSREVLVLVAGAEKAKRVQEVLEQEPEPERLPIQFIQPVSGRYNWFMDVGAAGM